MVLTDEKRRVLTEMWETPGGPSAFSSVDSLYREVKKNRHRLPYITRPDIVKFLSSIDSYTLTKQSRKPGSKKKLPKIVCAYTGYQMVADLMSVATYAAENDHVRYLLCVVDCFSRMSFVEPLLSKSGRSVVEALDKIFDRSKIPAKFQTDRGMYEF